ncbi:hypothetical protein NFI96_005249 [Prochilodus magdalenae]|nr:hypothetical protein NFI96_005249 [Prochilodus magdalenae]
MTSPGHSRQQSSDIYPSAPPLPVKAQEDWSSDILTNFYRCTIESILTACITVWYGSCTAYDRKALKRVVRTAESIIGSKLPDLQDIYHTMDNFGVPGVSRNIKVYLEYPVQFWYTLFFLESFDLPGVPPE